MNLDRLNKEQRRELKNINADYRRKQIHIILILLPFVFFLSNPNLKDFSRYVFKYQLKQTNIAEELTDINLNKTYNYELNLKEVKRYNLLLFSVFDVGDRNDSAILGILNIFIDPGEKTEYIIKEKQKD